MIMFSGNVLLLFQCQIQNLAYVPHSHMHPIVLAVDGRHLDGGVALALSRSSNDRAIEVTLMSAFHSVLLQSIRRSSLMEVVIVCELETVQRHERPVFCVFF